MRLGNAPLWLRSQAVSLEHVDVKRPCGGTGGALTRALDLQVFLRAPPYTRFNLALGRLLMTKLPILLPAHYGYKSLVLLFASLAFYTLYVCGVLVPSLRYLCQAILEYTA